MSVEPKQDRSRATRQRLLESAVRCVAHHGWSAATVSVIAADAGISRGALQHHFPTREELVVAALEHMFDERRLMVEALAPPQLTGARRVHVVVGALVELYMGDLFRAALQAWVVAASDPQMLETIQPLERRFARSVHAAAVQHLGVDDSDPHVRTLIQATLDLARGLALANLLTDDSKRRQRIVRTFSMMLAQELGVTD